MKNKIEKRATILMDEKTRLKIIQAANNEGMKLYMFVDKMIDFYLEHDWKNEDFEKQVLDKLNKIENKLGHSIK